MNYATYPPRPRESFYKVFSIIYIQPILTDAPRMAEFCNMGGMLHNAEFRLSQRRNDCLLHVGLYVNIIPTGVATPHQTGIVFLVFGVFLIFGGLFAESTIDTSVVSASEEEVKNAKTTPLSRALVVVVGLLMAIEGIFKLVR